MSRRINLGSWMILVCLFTSVGVQAQQGRTPQDKSQGQAPRSITADPEIPRGGPDAGPAQNVAVPRLIKFAGTLKDAQGKPLSNTVGLTFAIYKEEEGGAPLWLETQNVELDEQGHYSVLLGATKSEGLPLEPFSSGEARWVGVQVQLPGEVEGPRVLLVSVPYALKAADADTLGGIPASAFVLAQPSGTASGPSVSGTTPGKTTASGTGNTAALFAPNVTVTSNATSTNTLGSIAPSTDVTGQLTFVGIVPCRIIETRGFGFSGQAGPPSLVANTTRTFQITGTVPGVPAQCGVPDTALAISVNFTVTNFAGPGDLRVFPAGATVPLASILNYQLENIANATTVPLGPSGGGHNGITVQADAAGTDFLADVNGYYLPLPPGGGVTSVTAGDASIAVGGTASAPTVAVANLGITSSKIAGGAVGTAQIAAGAVTSGSIAAGTIVDANISPSANIAPTKIAGTAATLGTNSFIASQTINSGGTALTANGTGASSIGLQATSNDAGGIGAVISNSTFAGEILAARDNTGSDILSVFPAGVRLKRSIINVPNDATVGTILNELAKFNPAGTFSVTSAGDAGGAVGIVVANAGTAPSVPNALVATIGQASCVFDTTSTPTVADYFQISPTMAGMCHDAGATYPASGQVLGRVIDTSKTPPQVFLFGTEVRGGPVVYNTSGVLQNAHIVTGFVILSGGTATVTLSGAAAFSANGSYNCVGTPQVQGGTTPNVAPVGVATTSGTSFVLSSTAPTPGVAFTCVGN